MIKQNDITAILDKIDAHSADQEPLTSQDITESSPNVFTSGFIDSEAGRRLVAALSAYSDNSSFSNANSRQKQEIKEQRAEEKRQVLYYALALSNYVDAVNNFIDAGNNQLTIADKIITEVAQLNTTAKALVESTADDPQFQNEEDQRRLNNVDRLSITLDQFIERSGNVFNTAQFTLQEVEKATNGLLGACTPATANLPSCEAARDELNQQSELFNTAMDSVKDIVGEMTDLSQGMVDEITLIFEGKDLTPEQEELLQRLNTQNTAIQEMQTKFNQGDLTLEEYGELLNQAKNAFENSTNAVINIDVEDPEIKNLQDKLATIQETLVAGVDVASSEETLKNLSDLQDQIEEQKERVQILEQAEKITEKYQNMSRHDFITEAYGGTFEYHANLNLMQNYFSENPEDKHVTNDNGEVIFYGEDADIYYYFPNNDSNANPIQINDSLTIAKARIEAYEGQNGAPPKPWGNDTRWGNSFQQLDPVAENQADNDKPNELSNFLDHASRLIIDGGEKIEDVHSNAGQAAAVAQEKLQQLTEQAQEQTQQAATHVKTGLNNTVEHIQQAAMSASQGLAQERYESFADTIEAQTQAPAPACISDTLNDVTDFIKGKLSFTFQESADSKPVQPDNTIETSTVVAQQNNNIGMGA